MSRVLVLFSTVDGQTARIAERVAETLRGEGHEVTLRSCQAEDAVAQLRSSDAVVLGSAVRYGDHVPPARKFAKANQPDLCARPGAFFSVCLSADGPGKKADEAQRYLDKFLARSGWTPQFVASFGGALLYPRYNPFIRFLMRLIVGHAGGETDTTREYEYTDWGAVERFTRAFSRNLPSVADIRPRQKSHA
jgi:menaquinone-dependent protoporphyrinogen oxidase